MSLNHVVLNGLGSSAPQDLSCYSIRIIDGATAGYILTCDAFGNASWSAVGSSGVSGIVGTANQVLANGTSGSAQLGIVTLTLPQSIGTTSNVAFNSLSLTTPLAVTSGGTGASDAATARTNLGLGTMAVQNANSVSITGGSLSGVSINATSLTATSPAIITGVIDSQLKLTDSGDSKTITLKNDNDVFTISNHAGTTIFTINGSTLMTTVGADLTVGAKTTTANFQMTTGATSGYVLTSDSSGNASWTAIGTGAVSSITGTANQVLANGTSGSPQTGPITLTLPQSIATTSNVQFNRVTLGSSFQIDPLQISNISAAGNISILPRSGGSTGNVTIEMGGSNSSVLNIQQTTVGGSSRAIMNIGDWALAQDLGITNIKDFSIRSATLGQVVNIDVSGNPSFTVPGTGVSGTLTVAAGSGNSTTNVANMNLRVRDNSGNFISNTLRNTLGGGGTYDLQIRTAQGLIDFYTVGTRAGYFNTAQDLILLGNEYLPSDTKGIYLGAGNDAYLNYNGTNLVINPRNIGAGSVVIPMESSNVSSLLITEFTGATHRASMGIGSFYWFQDLAQANTYTFSLYDDINGRSVFDVDTSDNMDIKFNLRVRGTVTLDNALGVTSGGTGMNVASQGDLIYGSAANTYSRLSKDTNATRYLSNTGTSNNPAWSQVNLANGVTGNLPVTNLNSGSGASASTYWRGDGTWASIGAGVTDITGTANQVLVNGTSGTPQSGAVTLTLPQSIATTSTVTFAGLTVSNATNPSIILTDSTNSKDATIRQSNDILYFRNNAGTDVLTLNSGGSSTYLTPGTGVTSNFILYSGTGASGSNLSRLTISVLDSGSATKSSRLTTYNGNGAGRYDLMIESPNGLIDLYTDGSRAAYFDTAQNFVLLGNSYIPSDTKGIFLGAGNDTFINYNGSDLVINARNVGSGLVNVLMGASTSSAFRIVPTTTGGSKRAGLGVGTWYLIQDLPNVNAETLDIYDATATASRLSIATNGNITISNDLAVNGNVTMGNASGDAVTVNAATCTYVNDTTFTLKDNSSSSLNIGSSGLTNLINIDTTNSAEKVTINGNLTITGNVLRPGQCAFMMYVNSPMNNATGDGTLVTPTWTSTLNVGSNFNTGTGTFTAPSTGIYIFTYKIYFSSINTAAHTRAVLELRIGSTPNIYSSAYDAALSDMSVTGSEIIYMTSGQTAIVTTGVFGSTKTVAIEGLGGLGQYVSTYSGYFMG